METREVNPGNNTTSSDLYIIDPMYARKHAFWDWRKDALGKKGLSDDYVISGCYTWTLNNDKFHLRSVFSQPRLSVADRDDTGGRRAASTPLS